MIYDGNNIYSYDPENRLVKVKKFPQGPSALSLACDTDLVFTTGGSANWSAQSTGGYFEADCAKSGLIGNSQETWLQTTVSGIGTLSFYWSVSSDGGDYLRFYIDDAAPGRSAGGQGWTIRQYSLNGGAHTLKWVYSKDSVGSGGSDCGWVDRVKWTPSWTTRTLADGVDSFLTYTTGGTSNWAYYGGGYLDADCAKSGGIGNSQESWLQAQVTGAGTVKFWWSVSSEDDDYLEFWIDGVLQDGRISGSVDWQEKTFTVTGTSTHTLKWRYVKDGGASEGDDSGYVDYIQWSGPLPQDPDPSVWRQLTYVYDAQGRRSEKQYDCATVLKYIYDGDSCIAEYDAGGNLRRKYVYGPGVDQPVCMIEATVTPAATYYYHFDALGSVVALTNSSGNTVQVYDYSVYGQVGATDPSHTNRFMFTGREFDKETGLYYYRARYYKPEIGRFLQVDPVGYDAGMNLYRYCGNNPWNLTDPYGNDYNDYSPSGPDPGADYSPSGPPPEDDPPLESCEAKKSTCDENVTQRVRQERDKGLLVVPICAGIGASVGDFVIGIVGETVGITISAPGGILGKKIGKWLGRILGGATGAALCALYFARQMDSIQDSGSDYCERAYQACKDHTEMPAPPQWGDPWPGD